MNLRDLEYLVALAEHRHFGRAAAACFVSQPTMSAQIRKLEQELGAELFERGGRETLLTDVGRHIVERARAALVEIDAIRDLARLSRDPESGTVRLGVFPTLAPYLLPHVVPAVHAELPNLELLLVEEKTDELVRQLRDGRLDTVVLASPVASEGWDTAPLFEEDFVLAVPAGHPLAARPGPVPASALAGERLLLLEEGHCLRDQALSVCRLVGATERDGFRATSLETLRQMVAAGVAITLLPRLAVSDPVPVSPEIALVELAAPRPSRQVSMFWRASSPYRAFLPRLAALFRDLPPGLVRPLPAAVVHGTAHPVTALGA